MQKAPTEKQYAVKLRKALRDYYDFGVVDFKIHGGPFQQSGLPDIICSVLGYFVAIELKRPGEKLTPAQDKILMSLTASGAYARYFTTNMDPEYVINRIRVWIKQREEGKKKWEIEPEAD